jgi:hypothetical protein
MKLHDDRKIPKLEKVLENHNTPHKLPNIVAEMG